MQIFRESPKKQLPARLKRVDRTGQPKRKRTLTDLQRSTFLGAAAARVREEAKTRACKWLRPLDVFQESGYRTNQVRWNSIAEMIEPVLARMDIATLSLGWLDQETGAFRLNRQRGIAEDTSLQEWTVSRALKALEAAKYVHRKIRRVYHDGWGWITSVAIIIRPRFFVHLGLGHELAKAHEKKKAKLEAARAKEYTKRFAKGRACNESYQKARDRRVRADGTSEEKKVGNLAISAMKILRPRLERPLPIGSGPTGPQTGAVRRWLLTAETTEAP